MTDDEIFIRLDEIANAANRLKTEAENIEDAANKSNIAIDDLRAMKSKRIRKIIVAWDQLLKSLKENVTTVQEIAEEQVKAERDFRAADGG
jgi:RecA/RadA recombinase